MKYVKQLYQRYWYAVILPMGMVLGLSGCATGSGSDIQLATDNEVRPNLLSTAQYIPKQTFDEEGAILPYEPSQNPYLSQGGRVNRDSVVGFMEARRAYNAGQYQQAQKSLVALTEQDQSLSGPWVILDDIATDLGNHSQASSHYLEAIAVNPININAYLRLAKVQRVQGHFLHAQNTYAKVLSIWPDFPEAHLNLAVLYDVYLNHPLRAQKHMEAYQYLTDAENREVAGWLAEIQQRTGVAPAFRYPPSGQDTDPKI